jgi:hypothetical protein
MPAGGGDARRLTQIAWQPRPTPVIDWTRDAKNILVADMADGLQSSLYLVSVNEGNRRRITWQPSGTKGDFSPAVS